MDVSTSNTRFLFGHAIAEQEDVFSALSCLPPMILATSPCYNYGAAQKPSPLPPNGKVHRTGRSPSPKY